MDQSKAERLCGTNDHNELRHLELTDIAIIQVGINIYPSPTSPLRLGGIEGGQVVSGWCEAEERLAEAMRGLPNLIEEASVGRTIVYAASIPADSDGDDADTFAQTKTHTKTFGIRDSGFGVRDSGFGIRDSGFGVRYK